MFHDRDMNSSSLDGTHTQATWPFTFLPLCEKSGLQGYDEVDWFVKLFLSSLYPLVYDNDSQLHLITWGGQNESERSGSKSLCEE